MKKILSLFKLKKEAELLDSIAYIIKSFLAVVTAYLIGSRNALISKDMISILFGLMLTLEPVTLTGIKNGINQLYASILGAISTAFIVYIFGINMWTIGLSMAFTLYVCLKINWKEVSPVAIFTSIYMTQYVQKTAAGQESMLLTFRLRILALGFGVLIAVIFNYIFSMISYKKMIYKRASFLLKNVSDNLINTKKCILNKDSTKISNEKNIYPQIFNTIDFIYGQFEDIKKQLKWKVFHFNMNIDDFSMLQSIILLCRRIAHYNYDMYETMVNNDFDWKYIEQNEKEIVDSMDSIIKQIDYISHMINISDYIVNNTFEFEENFVGKIEGNNKYCSRLLSDIDEIHETLNKTVNNQTQRTQKKD